MKYTIKTPVEGYRGVSASLHFFNGQAETNSDKLADWFIKHGYKVICNESEPAKPKTTRKKGGNSND